MPKIVLDKQMIVREKKKKHGAIYLAIFYLIINPSFRNNLAMT